MIMDFVAAANFLKSMEKCVVSIIAHFMAAAPIRFCCLMMLLLLVRLLV